MIMILRSFHNHSRQSLVQKKAGTGRNEYKICSTIKMMVTKMLKDQNSNWHITLHPLLLSREHTSQALYFDMNYKISNIVFIVQYSRTVITTCLRLNYRMNISIDAKICISNVHLILANETWSLFSMMMTTQKHIPLKIISCNSQFSFFWQI